MNDISLFICLAGIGFIAGLWVWDRIRLRYSLPVIISLSLLFEIILLFNVYILESGYYALIILGIAYGIYNCFYWITQRALFFDLIDVNSSGREYGNLQIFVGVLLQIGIVTGGFLLENSAIIHLLTVSVLIAAAGLFLLISSKPSYPLTLSSHDSLKLERVIQFKDKEYSRLMFVVDGVFLFAESFFWLISLFLLAHQSFSLLGIMVLSFAVIFGVVFYLLKNTIDKLDKNRVFYLAVILYALSWAMRALIEQSMTLEIVYVFLVLITFCTAFFRLAMNKRFYDLAKLTLRHDYLVLKSYYSQFFIAVFFAILALILTVVADSGQLLKPIYWGLAVLAFSYLVYGTRCYAGHNFSS